MLHVGGIDHGPTPAENRTTFPGTLHGSSASARSEAACASSRVPAVGPDDQGSWLVKTPGPVTAGAGAKRSSTYGIEVTSRELTLHPPPTSGTVVPNPTVAGFSLFGIGTLIGGLGLLEVVLLAGPAFAVGARRRQRELALVATSGGTPSTLRRIVLADGIVGGVAAAVVGVVVGLAAAIAGRPFLEEHLAHARFGAYRIYPVAILAVVGLALLTGVLGALVPGRSRPDARTWWRR